MHLLQRVALLIVLSHISNAWFWGGGGGGSQCSDGKKQCEWLNWEEWGSCSQTCGGGTKKRQREGLCCKTDWSHEKCFSECGKSMSESYETTECNNYCLNGGTYSNGCTCASDKYGYCCGSSCPSIAHCSKVRCSSIFDNICTECVVQGVDKNSSLYWPISGNRKCEATCSYDGRWCWPGSCKNSMNELDGLAPSCKCHQDFKKYSFSDAKCELQKKPYLATCRATTTSKDGEMKSTVTNGECMNEGSVYINFQPVSVKFTLEMSFALNITQPVPHYIHESNFGIVNGSMSLKKYQVDGLISWTQTYTFNTVGDGCSESFNNSDPAAELVKCESTKYLSLHLTDGEWLCTNFKAYAGGFLISKTFSRTLSSKQLYSPTSDSKEVCFRYDVTSPVHCKEGGKCNKDPIQLVQRITSDPYITVGVDGWFDPSPYGGNSSQASEIIKYEVAIHKMSSANQTMRMETAPISSKHMSSNETRKEFELSLPDTEPSLFGISLSVVDTAGNVKMARCFVYFDNSSVVQINHHHPFLFNTANPKTGYNWQTNHRKICMSWTDRYYNSHNVLDSKNVLRKIQSDNLFTGIYDQISGTLPVTGTKNVHGIVQFEYRYKMNHGDFTSFQAVPNFTGQKVCEELKIHDGETYTFEIKSVDLNKKILTEKQVVYIDASVPDISNIWLERDGHVQLYVHNSTDLSKMTFQFDVLDFHSGIHSVQWTFGTTQHGAELGTGAEGVQRRNGSCGDTKNCYCPTVGVCETYRYSVDLNSLVANNTHIGQHHREYFFAVKATNNARLVAIERIEILADDSAPVHGVVQEGTIGSPDVDFSSDDYIYVNWDGFIDHESGIKFYRVGFAATCLSQEILVRNGTDGKILKIFDVTDLSIRVNDLKPNKYYTTVIAFNNAMEPSDAVCSDGVTIDFTHPLLQSMVLEHANAREVIGCFNGKAFLVLRNMTIIPLIMSDECIKICKNINEMDIIPALPIGLHASNDSDVASELCGRLPSFDYNWHIYLPTDKIFMSWNVSDTESQIREVNVGFSSSATNDLASDINGYQKVHTTTNIRKAHSGLDRGKLFYIMIKATNKADLDHVVKFGPVIIDETGPKYTSQVDVVVRDKYIYCIWTNKTFFDTEQKEDLSTFLFRIGTGKSFVTPLLQAHIQNQCPLGYALSKCFKYPLHRLQAQDSEKGHSYYLNIYVYNIAGHYLTVKSKDFTIPSVYPPGHGVVLDTFHRQRDDNVDIDFSTSTNIICGSWTGFRHHMNVTFHVGVGKRPNTDDIISFIPSNNTKKACINANGLRSFVTYYFTVNASCSGGSTVASSDGFVIIDDAETISSLRVHNGKLCSMSKSANFSNTTATPIQLAPEKIYTLISGADSRYLTLQGAIWLDKDRHIFKPSPTLKKGCEEKSYVDIRNLTCHFIAEECFEDFSFTASDHKMSFYWSLDSNIEQYVTNYKIVVLGTTSNEFISTIESTEKQKKYEFQTISLKNNHSYYAAVEVCFDSICVGPGTAEPFRAETDEPIGGQILATIASKGFNKVIIELSFEAFQCTSGTARGYNFALFKTEELDVQITEWQTLHASSSVYIQEKREFGIAIYPHSEPVLCVQAVCISGSMASRCVKTESKEHLNNFNIDILYEIESSHFLENGVMDLVNTATTGYELTLIHKIEAEFVKPGSEVFGVILNSAERTTEWFLMRKREIPSVTCKADPLCIESSVTKTGYCQLPTLSLQHQVKYYICAVSNTTKVQREQLTEVIEKVSTCGNGFIIDGEPPQAGNVKIISNSGGFLTDPNYIHLTWEGFSDFEKQVNVSSLLGIANYKLAIGSFPGGEDLYPFHNVGVRHSAYVSTEAIKDGTKCFATIRAFDNVGYMTEVISEGVILDSSPPLNGTVIVESRFSHLNVVPTEHLFVHWESFEDPESGISNFSLSITESLDNFKYSHTVYTVNGDYFQLPKTEDLLDGHVYYAVVMATNHAGLHSRSISQGFIIDNTPPEEGNVRDGSKDNQADLDYQEDISSLGCHWDRFHDAHSKIVSYEVGFGKRPFEFDIAAKTNVGLHTGMKCQWFLKSIVAFHPDPSTLCSTIDKEYVVHSRFTPGIKYFCTVTACNAAGLCTTRTSDGILLDNSPPIPGIVHVGLGDRHQHYLSQSNMISAQWVGFQDPHSGIVHFKWCIGTLPSKCDVRDFQNCLLSDSITISNLNLQEQTPYYIVIEATNSVELTTNRSSSSFTIDTTPPYLIKRPVFITTDRGISYREHTQFDNSVLFIEWSFEDDESHITDQTLILRSHHNGHVVKEKMVMWNQKYVTVKFDKDNLLRSGDKYTAWVTACNGAGICSTNSTEEILIDSTPPQTGGFHKGMKWRTTYDDNKTTTELDLNWYGFTDVESGIAVYYVTVSRNYSGAELSDGPLRFPHRSSSLQQTTIILSEFLQDTDKIVLSIWAENGVGLQSAVGKVTVYLASSSINHAEGFLEIERHSCDSHYCNFDCTCAVVGKKCVPTHKYLTCNNKTNQQVTSVNVTFGLLHTSQKITLSSSCFSLFWTSDNSSKHIQRYEWSVGIMNDEYGAGIFDPLHENIWNDVDKRNFVTYCLQSGRHLVHREQYVGYIKAWYNEDTYNTFISLPVLVDLTAPSIRRGSSVMESIDGCVSDIDYMNSTYNFWVCWRKVFIEHEGEITKFSISGGTSPEGDDFLPTTDLPNSEFSYILIKPNMEKGKRYYFTITATNNVGLRSSKTSDGILVDEDSPVAGVIFNTPYHRNIRFQSSTQMGASWHGFDDHQSFIHHYSVLLMESILDSVVVRRDTVGLSNTLTFKNVNLTPGKEYYFEIFAVDAVGHLSESVRSESVTVDTTSPLGQTCEQYNKGRVLNPISVSHNIGILDKTLYTFKYLLDLKNRKLVKLSFSVDGSLAFHHVSLWIGKQHSFSLHMVKTNRELYQSEYQFISSGEENLEMEVKLFTDKLQTAIFECANSSGNTKEIVDIQQLSPTTFYISSLVYDPESGIREILMSVGTTKSGYQILPKTRVSEISYTIEATVPHGAKLYPKAMVSNYAGLSTLFTSRHPLVVDHTPPDIYAVSQNIQTDKQVQNIIENIPNVDKNITSPTELNATMPTNATSAANTSFVYLTTISLTWEASDPESSLQDCFCSVGLFKGIEDVVGWTTSGKEMNKFMCILNELQLNDGEKVFPRVKCINKVQISKIVDFDPMVVSYKAPALSHAEIDFLIQNEISADHGTPLYPIQSNSHNVKFSWHGFHDNSGHLTYETQIFLNGRVVIPWSGAGSKRLRCYALEMNDSDDVTVETRALNLGNISSVSVNSTISIQTGAPRLTGKSASIERNGNNLRLMWTDVFMNDIGGPYVFTVTAGSGKGQADVQRPILTTSFFCEMKPEQDIKEVYVVIKAMSVTGTESVYRKTFLL